MTTTTKNLEATTMTDDTDNTQMQRRKPSPIADRDKYAPEDFGQLMRFAEIITQSGLCPDHIKGPADAVMIVQQGQELGLSPMQSLQGLHVIRGKVGLNADTMKAVAESSGLVEKWHYEEKTDTTCTVVVKREGRQPFTTTWNKQRAKDAGLWSSTYKKYPAEMLRHRADAEAARAVFPDLLLGLYTPQELRSISDGQQQRQRQQKADSGLSEFVQGSEQPDQQQPPQEPDTVDAEFTEEPRAHWTEVDWSHMEPDADEAWKNAIRHLCGALDEHLGELKDAALDIIAARHQVDSKKQIPGETLGRWAELIDNRPEKVRGLIDD